ncbi:hypothetical protein [Streptomyces sudanensis]|uniref:hypothetical protein n=1 Tax=Streptomyces sudanensis TaxID=436397 RepID=UPI003FD761B9
MSTEATGRELASSWEELGTVLADLTDRAQRLSELGFGTGGQQSTVSVGDLVKAGALSLRAGQQPPDEPAGSGRDSVPLLTVADLLTDSAPSGLVTTGSAPVVVERGDVVVAGVVRAFRAWVHEGPPTALGPQLYALRVDPAKMDAHFLAGCLRAPSNGRQAGTHASSSSRIDIRRLHVLQLPLEKQAAYAEAFRHLRVFESQLVKADGLGRALVSDTIDQFAVGGLAP